MSLHCSCQEGSHLEPGFLSSEIFFDYVNSFLRGRSIRDVQGNPGPSPRDQRFARSRSRSLSHTRHSNGIATLSLAARSSSQPYSSGISQIIYGKPKTVVAKASRAGEVLPYPALPRTAQGRAGGGGGGGVGVGGRRMSAGAWDEGVQRCGAGAGEL